MMLALIELAAAAGAAAPARSADACVGRSRDEVVVCGSRTGQSPYRLPKLPNRYEPKKIRAEADLMPGVHTRAHVDSATMPDGNRSNRIMLTLSTAF